MYSIKFGVPITEYSVCSVEYYSVVTGWKTWRKDICRRLPNKSIIHWIFHRLLRAIWFMNSLKEVSQEKKQKKLITKVKQWKLQWVLSQLFHPVINTDSSLTQTTKLWNVILFWTYNCFKSQLQEIYFVSHSIVKFEFCVNSKKRQLRWIFTFCVFRLNIDQLVTNFVGLYVHWSLVKLDMAVCV